jgi:hypothetical protein
VSLITVSEALAAGRIAWVEVYRPGRRLVLRLSDAVEARVFHWRGWPGWAVDVMGHEVAWSAWQGDVAPCEVAGPGDGERYATEADACASAERWLMAAGMGVPS